MAIRSFEINDGCRASDIEEILSHTKIARTSSLLACEVGEPMLDSNTFAERAAARWRCGQLAKSMLKLLVLGDADCSSCVRRSHRAARTLRASTARVRIELDDGAGLKVFDLPGGALDGAVAHVDDEVGFRDEFRLRATHGLQSRVLRRRRRDA